MARYIRYMEDGVWKYASVKDVGDLQGLKTTNKSDIVSAINEVVDKSDSLETDVDDAQAKIAVVQQDLLNKADVTYVDGQLVKKVDVEQYQQDYNNTLNALQEKVDLDQYTTDYNSVRDDLAKKVEETEFNNLSGRVDTTETEIANINNELSTKVTHTEFDDAVGVNKWIVEKYPVTGTDFSQSSPSFALIKGLTASEVKEIDDSLNLVAYQDTNTISHYFTNVKLTQAKTLNIKFTYDSGLAVYMNGAMIHQQASNGQTPVSVSLSLRAGWNTIEILLANNESAPVLTLDTLISQQVDKMTTVIGVGDKNETRLTQAETEIKQNADSIQLKAEKTEVESLGNRVTANEASIEVLNNEITSKVEKEEFDAYSQRLETAESNITQNANAIQSKVDKTDFDLLNGRVEDNETSISQLSDSIELKAEKSVVDNLSQRMSNAETAITQNANEIALRAKQTDLDATNQRLSNAEASITENANEIALRVKQTDFDNLENRVTNAETAITQNANEISLKANKSDVYTISDIDQKFENVNSSITQNANEIALKVDATDVYTKSQVDDKLDDKANQTDLDNVVQRITDAETSITENAQQIALKANQSDLDALSGRVSNAEAQLTVQAGEIATKVSSTTFTQEIDNTKQYADAQASQAEQNAKSYTDSGISGAKELALAMANGKMLFTDPMFVNGTNGLSVYNNSGGNDVTLTRIQSPTDAPTTSGYVLEVKTTGVNVTPTWGGFKWGNQSRANAIFIYRIIAKIPTGRTLNFATNATGNGSVGKWLTSNAGTDKYEEYIYKMQCGSSGTFSSTGYFYVNGGDTPSLTSPLIWHVAYATVIDITDDGYIYSRVSSAETSITQLSNQIALKANQSDLDTLTGRVSDAEAQLTVQANEISTKVSSTDYNGNTIASLINQTSTTIKLKAEKIDLQGDVTVQDGKLVIGEDVIGKGNNYILNSDFSLGTQNWTVNTGFTDVSVHSMSGAVIRTTDDVPAGAVNYLRIQPPDAQERYIHQNLENPNNFMNKKLTLSFYQISGGMQSGYFKVYIRVTYDTATETGKMAYFNTDTQYTSSSPWRREKAIIDLSTLSGVTNITEVRLNIMTAYTGAIWLTGFQLEDGEKAGGWRPNPKDNPSLNWVYSGTTLIDGGQIQTNSVTANKLNVTSLSAISANLGNVNAGNITGVTITINEGDIIFKDKITSSTYSLIPKKNMIYDHSFELMKTSGSIGSDGYFAIAKTNGNMSGGWIVKGSPKLSSNLNTDVTPDAIFGHQAVVVNSSNYVEASFDVDYFESGKTYTVSVFARRANNYTSGKPKIYVYCGYDDLAQGTFVTKWSTTYTASSAVPSDYSIVRYAFTFTMPSSSTLGASESLLIRLYANDSNWVLLDGVQFIESDRASIYSDESSFFHFLRNPQFEDTVYFNNVDIYQVNSLHFADPGGGEGIYWDAGNGWKIVEAPNNLSNDKGNIQFVQGNSRKFVVETSGSVWAEYGFHSAMNGGTGDRGYFATPAQYAVVASDHAKSGEGLFVGNDGKPRISSVDIYNRTYSGSGPTVTVTSAGTLGRLTSATKYKVNIEEVKTDGYAERVLQLKPKSWYDKGAVEAYADYLDKLASGEEVNIEERDIPYIERHYGLIAEDLVDIGLSEYVLYGAPNENGEREVEGIAYDRLWTLLIPLVKEQREKIAELENRLSALESKGGN